MKVVTKVAFSVAYSREHNSIQTTTKFELAVCSDFVLSLDSTFGSCWTFNGFEQANGSRVPSAPRTSSRVGRSYGEIKCALCNVK